MSRNKNNWWLHCWQNLRLKFWKKIIENCLLRSVFLLLRKTFHLPNCRLTFSINFLKCIVLIFSTNLASLFGDFQAIVSKLYNTFPTYSLHVVWFKREMKWDCTNLIFLFSYHYHIKTFLLAFFWFGLVRIM